MSMLLGANKAPAPATRYIICTPITQKRNHIEFPGAPEYLPDTHDNVPENPFLVQLPALTQTNPAITYEYDGPINRTEPQMELPGY
jgi:hypothetical protein